jgi:hypothetical protein
VEVSTPDGNVFVVADSDHLVAAVTDADPTVGLVFYDLKTALRAVREATARTSNGTLVTAVSSGAEGDDEEAPAGKNGGKWRKKKS